MINLTASPFDGDAPKFVSRVGEIVNGVMASGGWSAMHLIKIDNWFGDKWLGFSHNIGGYIEHHKSGRTLTVPPFKPSRVLSEEFFRVDAGHFMPAKSRPVHIDQYGGANDLRRVHELFPDSALFWWSGRSFGNGRGSLMAYVPLGDQHYNWYLEMSASNSWRVSKFVGITAEELDALLQDGQPAN